MKKPSPKVITSICTLMVAGSAMFALRAGEHAGHDHDHSKHDHSNHDHKKASPSNASAGSKSSVKLDATKRSELGIEIAEVPTRTIGDGSDEVSALPKGSVFTVDGKTFVFAIPDGAKDQFEKWEVTLGARDAFFVEAKTGVFPGDRIVIAGVGSIRQMANSGKELTEETEEESDVAAKAIPEAEVETDVAAKAIPETDKSAEASPAKKSSEAEVCPLNRRSLCPNEKRSHASKSAPGCPAQFRECDLIEISGSYDPHFHDHEFGHFAPHCDDGYHTW